MRHDAAMTKDTSCVSHECASGPRNRFFRGKQMRAEDFEREQLYSIGRRRLVNRAVLGWGVVYGFPLTGPLRRSDSCTDDPKRQDAAATDAPDPSQKPPAHRREPGPLAVGSGFALDEHGREILLVDSMAVDAKTTFVLEAGASGCQVRAIDTIKPGRYVLAAHYAERRFGDANLPAACGCDGPQKKYVCETVVFSLRALGDCPCPCAEQDCARECACGASSPCDTAGRGPHACLCQWVMKPKVAGDTPALCEWRGFWIDPAAGVDLACVTISEITDKCALVVVGWIDDDCSPRRLVKSNDLLYDLARGCDLTRIRSISWEKWHRAKDPVGWEDFARMFRAGAAADGTTEFVVTFSGPVLTETVRPDVVVMRAVTVEQPTGWRVARRVPISDLDLTPDPAGPGGPVLPAGTTNRMRLKARTRWIRDEIDKGGESWLSEREFTVEIEVIGDYILDCHGQAVDANAVGLRASPTGNGTPGGTFLSTFRVQRKPLDKAADAA